MDLNALKRRKKGGFLDGHFLIAMPGMADNQFARSVVYICAHSDEGAMGFIINKPQSLTFSEILTHLDVIKPDDQPPPESRQIVIRRGGPVETSRGFVLHSDDYMSQGSIPVSEDLSLTSTVDIVKAIWRGRGPERAVLMMGYAGWRPGQLEMEIANNGWLTCPADEGLIFEPDIGSKYDHALRLLGINPAMLSREAGHA